MSISALRMSFAGNCPQVGHPFQGLSLPAPSDAQEYGLVFAGTAAMLAFSTSVALYALSALS